MRYDKLIFFQKYTPGAYSADTGDYEDPGVKETAALASIMDAKEQAVSFLFGKLQPGTLIIHLQTRVTTEFDRIRVDAGSPYDGLYELKYRRCPHGKDVLLVSEVV